ncbi:MAG: spore cortex biosynthesis protein YabQ [Bacillota bacterium]|nr:spore cortex biosynthesis protein YabQ [Bacillota bacterium]
MMHPLGEQVIALAATVAGGMVVGFFFDLYRLVRSRLAPGPVFTQVGDLLYWAVATGAVFLLLLAGNQGEFRLYVVAGLGVGLLLYFRTLSGRVLRAGLLFFRAWGWGWERVKRGARRLARPLQRWLRGWRSAAQNQVRWWRPWKRG